MPEEVVQADAAAAAVPGEAGENPQQAAPSFYSLTKGFIVRAVVIYAITSFFRKGQAPTTETATGSAVGPATVRTPATNLYPDGVDIELYTYLSDLENVDSRFPDKLLWHQKDLVYGDWTSGSDGDGCYYFSKTIETTKTLRNNGSMYLHAYLVRKGNSPDPSKKNHHKLSTVHITHRLNRYMKKKYRKTANLITGKTDKSDEEIMKAETIKEEIASHWHPNITINLVHDFTQWTPGMIPAPIQSFVEFTPAMDRYKPILFVNNYWSLIKDYQVINKTNTELNLTLTFQPLSMFKWQLYAAQTAKNKFGLAGGLLDGLQGSEDDEDSDAMKEAILETNPVLLALTMVVSILHSIFEFLAFKNDIQFWNNRQSLEGLSVRSVFFNVFQALIVLLYVCDNETNFVIKVSCFVGLGIECWKITKVKNVTINREKTILGIPTLKFEDKGSYHESPTKTYDQMAFRYLGVALFPLLGAYCCYSLFYYEHKGWYSFTLSMLYGFLLTFGFIMMTPQLFINYKLKSVAHLPWRMLTYKALNTFIDDIFAFVIKMPTMYRLGCLRDDVIFFIFLYQRYIYRIDPSRVNEFGFSQEMEKEALEKKNNPNAIVEPSSSTGEESEQKSIEEKKED